MERHLTTVDLPGLRRRSRADETRRRLLDAALAVFTKKGYRDAAMDDIVQAAERSKGAAYFHFPSKKDIFKAVLSRLADMLEEKVERAIRSAGSPLERLESALSAVLDTFVKHRSLARIALIDLADAGDAMDDTMHGIRGRFARLIQHHLDVAVEQGAIDPVNTRLVSLAWFGAVNELVVSWLRSESSPDLAREMPELRALLLRSVGAPVNARDKG